MEDQEDSKKTTGSRSSALSITAVSLGVAQGGANGDASSRDLAPEALWPITSPAWPASRRVQLPSHHHQRPSHDTICRPRRLQLPAEPRTQPPTAQSHRAVAPVYLKEPVRVEGLSCCQCSRVELREALFTLPLASATRRSQRRVPRRWRLLGYARPLREGPPTLLPLPRLSLLLGSR